MINYDDVTKENIDKHDLNWSQIPDHPYGILLIGGSGSRKAIALLNLIKQQVDDDEDYRIIGKIYLHVKDPYGTKYKKFIKKR